MGSVHWSRNYRLATRFNSLENYWRRWTATTLVFSGTLDGSVVLTWEREILFRLNYQAHTIWILGEKPKELLYFSSFFFLFFFLNYGYPTRYSGYRIKNKKSGQLQKKTCLQMYRALIFKVEMLETNKKPTTYPRIIQFVPTIQTYSYSLM